MDLANSIFSALSAVGALAALIFAYLAIREARAGRREDAEARRRAEADTAESRSEAHAWREADLEAQRREREASEAAHAEHVAELRRVQEASAAQHQAEMADRRAAAESEIRLARISALERVADALVALVTRAQEEALNPPPPSGPHSPFRRTLLPTTLLRLKAAIAVYGALGGPELNSANEFAASYHMAGDNADQWIGKAVTALGELERVARGDPAFTVSTQRSA